MIDLSLVSVFAQTISLRDLYFQWESAGIFEFLLPALLIFAVIFGILMSTKIMGGNRGVNFIISLSIALLAIRVPIVSQFFTELFPNFAIGLGIIVVAVIMMGLFVQKGNMKEFYSTMMWSGLGIAVIIAIIIFNNNDWYGSFWWQENWVSVLWVVILVLVVAPLVIGKEKDPKKYEFTLPVGPIRDGE